LHHLVAQRKPPAETFKRLRRVWVPLQLGDRIETEAGLDATMSP
jgi:hypothetical protein